MVCRVPTPLPNGHRSVAPQKGESKRRGKTWRRGEKAVRRSGFILLMTAMLSGVFRRKKGREKKPKRNPSV